MKLASLLLLASTLVAALPCAAATSGPLVVVSNEYGGTLSFLDPSSRETVTTLPVGKRPRGIQLSPDGTRLFVALSGSPPAPPWVDESEIPPADKSADGIGVVDLERMELTRIIRGVSDPEQLAVGKDGARIYVASEDTGQLVVQDVASGATLASIAVGGEPEGVAISPDGSVVYVTSEEDHQVSAIDTANNELVGQFGVGKRPRAIAFSPDGGRAFVTGENDGTVSVVDTARHEVVRTIQLPGDAPRPMGVVVAPDGKHLYVATGRGQTVVAIDAETYAVTGALPVGERPWGIAIAADGSTLYTANGPSDDVSFIDADTLEENARVEVGERPWGVLVTGMPTRSSDDAPAR